MWLSKTFKTKKFKIKVRPETCFSFMFLIISHMNVQQYSLWSKSLILVIQFIPHLATRMILPPPSSFLHSECGIYYTAGPDSCISARMLSSKGQIQCGVLPTLPVYAVLRGSTASSLGSTLRKRPSPLSLMARSEGLTNIKVQCTSARSRSDRSHLFGFRK